MAPALDAVAYARTSALFSCRSPDVLWGESDVVIKRSGLLVVGCVMTKLATHSAGVKFKCHRTGQRRLSIDDGRSGRCEQKKRDKGRQEWGYKGGRDGHSVIETRHGRRAIFESWQ